MTSEIPKKLDWVTARAHCSISALFEQLVLEVEEDVNQRNKQRTEMSRYKFTTNQSGNVFNVYSDSGGTERHFVYFKLETNKITVKDDNALLFEATVTLNDGGECKPKINGQERELWQMRRMALEKLFFEVFHD